MNCRTLIFITSLIVITGCSSSDKPLDELPTLDNYCLAAQEVVTNTDLEFQLTIHETFTDFVKSKALIEGPSIQQFNWTGPDGKVVGISCKLKSADHLNLEFGEGSAGPDGVCQDMNQAVFMLIAPKIKQPAFKKVVLDPDESFAPIEGAPGLSGPAWLAPYQATSVDADGSLVIRTEGLVVNFTDERYAEAPARFRGIHYCHFIAPDYLRELMEGTAEPGVMLGRMPELKRSGF